QIQYNKSILFTFPVGISKSMNVSACNVTLLEEFPALPSEREQFLEKNDQHLKQIDKLLQEKNELLEKNKQLHQDRVSLNGKNKLLEQEKDQLFNVNLKKNRLRQWYKQLKQQKDELAKDKNELLQNKLELEKKKNELLQENKQLIQEECNLYQEKLKLQEEKDLLERKNRELEDKIVEKENQISELLRKVNKPKCPPGWQRFMSSCYQLSTEANTWMYAKQNCESKGAQLMMLNDETEQTFVNNCLVETSSTWIGLNVKHNNYSQSLKWVDGSEMTFSFFFSYGCRPNNHFYQGTSQESCMYMNASVYSSSVCDQKRGWICEM
uniref:C-type lectin domain-containing protein n=1 Tax=Poecilia formosa TaxID=48698 RepID=A0A087YKC1_POEFO